VDVGIEVLKDMEIVGRELKTSKVVIVTSSSFSSQASRYGLKKNIELIDREKLIDLAKKFSESREKKEIMDSDEIIPDNQDEEYFSSSESNLNHTNHDERYFNQSNSENFNRNNVNLGSESNKPNPKTFKNKLRNVFSNKNKKKSAQSKKRSPKSNLSNYKTQTDKIDNNKQNPNYKKILKAICSNTIVMIIIVVLLSYSLPYLLEKEHILSTKQSGLANIILSIIFSYGLSLAFKKDKFNLIIKGTIVFLVSLMILVLLKIIL
jgi:hypothetical protein